VSRTLEIQPKQWVKLKAVLVENVPMSVRLITSKWKEHFGFTVREQRYDFRDFVSEKEWDERRKPWVCLDFVDEKTMTFFVLKYNEYISNRNDNAS
jgi:hypothetical protein